MMMMARAIHEACPLKCARPLNAVRLAHEGGILEEVGHLKDRSARHRMFGPAFKLLTKHGLAADARVNRTRRDLTRRL